MQLKRFVSLKAPKRPGEFIRKDVETLEQTLARIYFIAYERCKQEREKEFLSQKEIQPKGILSVVNK